MGKRSSNKVDKAVAIRRQKLAEVADDIDRLKRMLLPAMLPILEELERLPEDAPSVPLLKSVYAFLDTIEDVVHALQDRRNVLVAKNPPSSLSDLDDRAYAAHHHLYNVEALVASVLDRAMQGKDTHVVALANLCTDQFPKLRVALYGEAMGP